MGIAVFFLLLLGAVAVIVYPLISRRQVALPEPVVTDGDIDQAVRRLRRARDRGGLSCPHCGAGYQAGDGFCVRCGGKLPEGGGATVVFECPSCGGHLREGDMFCPKCGHNTSKGEAI